MAWFEKLNDIVVKTPTGPLPSYSKIGEFIKQLINANRVIYHDSEAFEVTGIGDLINVGGQGAVTGTFIDNKNQKIKGKTGMVLPLMPNITQIPLIGEHVVVIEYQGQHYYTSIIKKKKSINENSIPGAAGDYEKNTKYGKTFERKDIRPVKVNEGDIVFNGRFGQSIKFGGYTENNKPHIKIRCGQRPISTIDEDGSNIPISEDIERDGSSIYLLDDGLPFNANTDREKFDGDQIKGKKILIKSDGIFISGRSNLKFKSVNNMKVDSPNFNVDEDEIKLGSIVSSELQPVVKGDDLMNLLADMITAVDNAFKAAAPTMVTGPSPGAPTAAQSIAPFTGALTAIKTQIKSKQVLSTDVKTK